MKRLALFFAAVTLSFSSFQTSAYQTTVISGGLDHTSAPCLYVFICGGASSHLRFEIDWDDSNRDGVGVLSDYIEARAIINGNLFGGPIQNGLMGSFDINVNLGAESFDWYWQGAVYPHLEYDRTTESITYGQSPACSQLDSEACMNGFFYTSPLVSNVEFSGYTVPEPSTLALVALGVLGLIASRRKKTV